MAASATAVDTTATMTATSTTAIDTKTTAISAMGAGGQHRRPDGGKISIIQAIVGAYGRPLEFFQPTHPEMTNNAMRTGMQELPPNSLVVIDDIDALFAGDREKKARSVR